ncbi:hypothetical protein JW962_02925 [Candidatus Dojkabacteria bacterium]|nr:hypothetical protein [Candidatus Dojkabacteria bacterium]
MSIEITTAPFSNDGLPHPDYYTIGRTIQWDNLATSKKFDSETSFREKPLCITRCIGHFSAAGYEWAIVRMYFPNGKWIGTQPNLKLVDSESFHIEPVRNIETGEYIPDREGPCIPRPGHIIYIGAGDEPRLWYWSYIEPEMQFPGLDWHTLLKEITPALMDELENGKSMRDS